MCLAIPMKIVELKDDNEGITELEGVRYEVNLSLVEGVQEGSYVIVHAGFAIEALDEEDAQERVKLFDEMAEAFRTEDGQE